MLTSLQRVEEAIAACSSAMGFEPRKWSALNNRGTAKFVAGRIEEALSDYQAALLWWMKSNGERGTIEQILLHAAIIKLQKRVAEKQTLQEILKPQNGY